MSRFFAASSSESSSDESEGEEQQVQAKPAAPAARMFMFSDDDEDSAKRVVRSAKDKRFDEIQGVIKQIKNHKKIRDISKVLTGFEDLGKAFAKAKNIVEKEGTPRWYIKCLVELEEFVNECWEDKKKFNKINAKSLATLRQKLRKYCRDYEKDIAAYKENPDVSGAEVDGAGSDMDDEQDSDDSDGGTTAADFLKKPAPAAPVAEVKSQFLKDTAGSADSDSEDSQWDYDSDEESSSSDDEGTGGQSLAVHFLKKTGDDKKEKERRERKKKAKAVKKAKEQEEEEEEAGWEEVKGGIRTKEKKPKAMFDKDVEITHTLVIRKMNEIQAARGKRATDRTEQISLLKELRQIAATNNLGPGVDIKIAFALISSVYDSNPNIATNMKPEMWELCLEHISDTLDLLILNPNIQVGENIAEESENFENTNVPYRIRGCILTKVERMEEEYYKMLQNCDAHSYEYVERLKDEPKVLDIVVRLQNYLEERGTSSEVCRIYLRNIEHIYYKYDYKHLEKMRKNREKENGEGTETQINGTDESTEDKKDGEDETKDNKEEEEKKDQEDEKAEDSCALMDRMCNFIYSKDSTDRIRTRAILCHIYHHALHDRWYEARDLMLMSHLQDTIQHADVPTQICYNRSMVQLGLCAFRQGNIRDAHNALLDIQSGGRAKELLAQGLLMRSMADRNAEQEKIEKRRQMPFHMHINLELLECVYLVSAMLLEIPYMAAHEFDTRRRMISKSFHHQLRLSERQALLGPPESMREHVVAASKAMKNGDWKGCRDFLINEKMNAKVWNLFPEKERVKKLIVRKIQEESLRTYLFTYGSVYESLSLVTLADMFDLEEPVVHSIISKMIINEELMASWDQPSHCVVMHRCEPTRLQTLSLQLSEKVQQLVENNERLMEMKQGSFHRQTQAHQGQQQSFGRRQQGRQRYYDKKYE
ncbi:eukaryotic translation initiation factor 3 subunit C-like [Ptychodera flava]|uniref:eukaryotic translation initiation factor 3 subunit C-like n=1 Tax=Ptychodera flava TaxID=63121 RepID=UPI00396A6EF3